MWVCLFVCVRACARARVLQVLATKNAGVDEAAAWIMAHMEDADFAAPLPAAPAAPGAKPAFAADPESVMMLGAS